MRPFVISILILLLITQTFSFWLVSAFYYINKDYIVAELCENRYRPQLKCEGKCVLMKKMKQAEEQEKDAPSSIKLEISSLFLGDDVFANAGIVPEFEMQTFLYDFSNNGRPVDRAIAIFHPPGAAPLSLIVI